MSWSIIAVTQGALRLRWQYQTLEPEPDNTGVGSGNKAFLRDRRFFCFYRIAYR